MDDLDRKIVLELKKDGRQSAQAIADAVDTSAVTVRGRIKALEDSGELQVVAVTDFGSVGYDVLLAIGIQVERRHAQDVAQDIAKLSNVFAVNLTTGAADIEILVGAHNFSDLTKFLQEDIGSVQGIGRLTTAVTLDVWKYQSDTDLSR
ncbi:MAG: Lrp/AsnC family transcriptional regulator [Pseudomonadota bacterium]